MSALRLSAFLLSSLALGFLNDPSAMAQQKASDNKGTVNQPKDKGKSSSTASRNKSEPGTMIPLNAGGWPVMTTYFESSLGKESPVVILLTSTEGPDKADARNRLIWDSTAIALQKAGFAVITVDLRKHGDSVPPIVEGKESVALKVSPDDYALMAAVDLETVKAFLMAQHADEKLNIRKLGIVSMGSSAVVALAFTVADWDKKPYPDGPTLALSTPRGQDVRALVFYSPATTVKGLNSTTLLKAIKPLPIAVHVVASKDRKEDLRNAEKFFKAVDPRDDAFAEFRKITLVPGDIHSERFLEGRFADATTSDILAFLRKNLAELNSPWVARKDRRQD